MHTGWEICACKPSRTLYNCKITNVITIRMLRHHEKKQKHEYLQHTIHYTICLFYQDIKAPVKLVDLWILLILLPHKSFVVWWHIKHCIKDKSILLCFFLQVVDISKTPFRVLFLVKKTVLKKIMCLLHSLENSFHIYQLKFYVFLMMAIKLSRTVYVFTP